jgi:hypothetical protein
MEHKARSPSSTAASAAASAAASPEGAGHGHSRGASAHHPKLKHEGVCLCVGVLSFSSFFLQIAAVISAEKLPVFMFSTLRREGERQTCCHVSASSELSFFLFIVIFLHKCVSERESFGKINWL